MYNYMYSSVYHSSSLSFGTLLHWSIYNTEPSTDLNSGLLRPHKNILVHHLPYQPSIDIAVIIGYHSLLSVFPHVP